MAKPSKGAQGVINHAREVARRGNGTFGYQQRKEPPAGLLANVSGPRVDAAYVSEILSYRNAPHSNDPEVLEKITEALNESKNFSAENVHEVSDSVWREHYGYTPWESQEYEMALDILESQGESEAAASIRKYVGALEVKAGIADAGAPRAVSLAKSAPDGINTPVPHNDPRLLAGEVFDKITDAHGRVFSRVGSNAIYDMPYAMRLQANRPLEQEEAEHLAQLMGYQYSQSVRGENMGFPNRDTAYSFIVSADTTKSSSDDVGNALARFEEGLETMFWEGSPRRKTNRTGPIGSQLVTGFKDPDLKFELYYDNAIEE